MKQKLDSLSVPYLPIIGDNEFHAGDEVIFNTVFEPQFENLAGVFSDSWKKAALPVHDPIIDKDVYLQNYSLDLKGLHLICTDWVTRYSEDFIEGEQAELYDYEGGTWQWVKQDIVDSIDEDRNNILIFSHHPMHVNPAFPLLWLDMGAFSVKDFKTITDFTIQYDDFIFANYTGHYHVPWNQTVVAGGYNIYAVRALHQQQQLKETEVLKEPTIKLINVRKKDNAFSFQNMLVYLNGNGKGLVVEDNDITN